MRSSSVPGGCPAFTGLSPRRGPPSASYRPDGSPRCPPGTSRAEAPQSSERAGVGNAPGALTGRGPCPAVAVGWLPGGAALDAAAGPDGAALAGAAAVLDAVEAGAAGPGRDGVVALACDVPLAGAAAGGLVEGVGMSRLRTLTSGP